MEWSVSIGLIAATIFLFKLGTRYLPIPPKEEELVVVTEPSGSHN